MSAQEKPPSPIRPNGFEGAGSNQDTKQKKHSNAHFFLITMLCSGIGRAIAC